MHCQWQTLSLKRPPSLDLVASWRIWSCCLLLDSHRESEKRGYQIWYNNFENDTIYIFTSIATIIIIIIIVIVIVIVIVVIIIIIIMDHLYSSESNVVHIASLPLFAVLSSRWCSKDIRIRCVFCQDHFQDVSCLMQASHCFNEVRMVRAAPQVSSLTVFAAKQLGSGLFGTSCWSILRKPGSSLLEWFELFFYQKSLHRLVANSK